MIQKMADILLAERDITKPPKKVGVNWVQSFLRRNPDLKVKYARRLSYKRALCEDPELINSFYTSLLGLIQQYGIANKNIYNFDKTGFSTGICTAAKVVCSSDRSGKPALIQPGNREWVTIIKCVGSSSVVVPPLIIFKSKHNQAE